MKLFSVSASILVAGIILVSSMGIASLISVSNTDIDGNISRTIDISLPMMLVTILMIAGSIALVISKMLDKASEVKYQYVVPMMTADEIMAYSRVMLWAERKTASHQAKMEAQQTAATLIKPMSVVAAMRNDVTV